MRSRTTKPAIATREIVQAAMRTTTCTPSNCTPAWVEEVGAAVEAEDLGEAEGFTAVVRLGSGEGGCEGVTIKVAASVCPAEAVICNVASKVAGTFFK